MSTLEKFTPPRTTDSKDMGFKKLEFVTSIYSSFKMKLGKERKPSPRLLIAEAWKFKRLKYFHPG